MVDLTVKFARDNNTWGYTRIQGALRNLGYRIFDTTVANILKRHGIEPAPDRKRQTIWSTFLKAHWEVLLDRDKNFDTFRGVLEGTDTKDVKLPVRSSNLNAYIERFMLSLKSECLERMIFFGERSLRKALTEFVEHYHHERNHQGLENEIIDAGDEVGNVEDEVQSRNRLGGLLRYYYRDAA